MQDNFDLKGYLRNDNKLLNEGIGGYFDLKPINYLGENLKINQKVNYNKKRYYVVASSSDNDLEPEVVAKHIPNFDPNDFVVLSLKDPTAFSGENLSTNDLITNKDTFLIKKESEIQAVSENEEKYTGNDPNDKEYDLPGIDDKPGYDVFGGYHGPRIKNAVVSLVRSGYAEGDIVHYVRAVIKAAKNLKN